jgi:hypothetical protein
MPRPVYIICSESGSEDIRTLLISYFNILERFEITKLPEVPADSRLVVPMLSFRATAVWMRLPEDDPEIEYEGQFRAFMPSRSEPLLMAEQKFFFDYKRPLVRLGVLSQGPPFHEPGIVRIEHRIRRVGTEDWLAQDYPIEVVEAPPKEPEKTNGPASGK